MFHFHCCLTSLALCLLKELAFSGLVKNHSSSSSSSSSFVVGSGGGGGGEGGVCFDFFGWLFLVVLFWVGMTLKKIVVACLLHFLFLFFICCLRLPEKKSIIMSLK